MTLILVRHAIAMRRRDWIGRDELRPLTPRGERQAEALAGVLEPLGVDRVLSSPSVRCIDTIQPFAARTGLVVELLDELREGSDLEPLPLLESLTGTPAVCSHGDVLLALLGTLAGGAEKIDGPDLDTFQKGSFWVLETAEADAVTARYVAPPA